MTNEMNNTQKIVKLFKLSEKQRNVASVIDLGIVSQEKKENLKNSLTYLELNDYVHAMKKLNELKNEPTIKAEKLPNEKSALLRKEIEKLDNEDLKRICFILRDSNANKNLMLPMFTNYFMQCKNVTVDGVQKVHYELKSNIITPVGSLTEDKTLWELTLKQDFLTVDNLIGCKYSDIILKISDNFDTVKSTENNKPFKEILTTIQDSIIEKLDSNKKVVTDYLAVHF